jgi:RNA polymerase sigma factor (sigma-70 family)
VPAADLALAGRLATGAAAGDERAWRELVRRFDPMLRSVVKGYRLDHADVDDVVQTTWFRAFRNLDRLKAPEAVGAWLAVTARREALRTLQRATREFPAAEPRDPEQPDALALDAAVFERERRRALADAVRRLPGRQRELLAEVLRRPCSTYDEISAALEMPLGSIGPTRERAFGRLRRDRALAGALA